MQGVLGPQSQRDLPLWLTGALLALVLHGGLAVWWMWRPSEVSAADAPPAAIMIEMADVTQAVQASQNNITTEKADAQASQAQNRERAQSEGAAAPAEKPQTEPLKAAEKPVPVVEKTQVKRPLTRSMSGQKDEKHQAQPKKQQQQQQQQQQQESQREQAASAPRVKAQVHAPPSVRNAAPQTVASNQLSPQQRATWMSKVMAHLEKRKRYPQTAQDRGQQGMATVEFTLDGQGNVQTVALKKGVGFSALDNEVLSLLRRASPVPAPPDGEPKRLTAQIQFFPRP